MLTLRDYQEKPVVDVREMLRAVRGALLVLATGAGKTVIFSYIAHLAANKGKRILILAHRDQLIKQASRKLSENGLTHGVIMAGYTETRRHLVQVASVQTLVRRLEKMLARGDYFDMIIIDEAHLSAAKSYMDICAAWPKAKILGVTGSPIRLDGKGLRAGAGGLFDDMITGISIGQLIEQAYLVKPIVYASKAQVDLSAVKTVGGDYDTSALADVMDKPVITGSAIEAWKRNCPGVPAIAWCANVSHAQHVAEQFNASGIPAICLSGKDDSAERDKALADLTAGRIKVITFAMLLVEGVDCPAIGCVIMLRPSMSLSAYLQTIGRGLRTVYAPGMPLGTVEQRFAAIDAGPKGRKCFVLDHAGLWSRHGFADEEREWSLDGVKKGKGKKKEAAPTPALQCPKCWVVQNPADPHEESCQFCKATPDKVHCFGCGHVFQGKVKKLNEVEGDLVEITPEMEAAMKRNRKAEIKNAKTLADYERIGATRGYSQGWARAAFDAKVRTREKYKGTTR